MSPLLFCWLVSSSRRGLSLPSSQPITQINLNAQFLGLVGELRDQFVFDCRSFEVEPNQRFLLLFLSSLNWRIVAEEKDLGLSDGDGPSDYHITRGY